MVAQIIQKYDANIVIMWKNLCIQKYEKNQKINWHI